MSGTERKKKQQSQTILDSDKNRQNPEKRILWEKPSTTRGFVFQYPPFPTLPETSHKDIFSPEKAGIYVHIPFCSSHCSYCYYAVSCNPSPEKVAEYLSALNTEIALQTSNPIVQNHTITTAYIGGGTPTILTPEQILALSEKIRNSFSADSLKEFTIETTPTDLTEDKLQAIAESAINRMSIGVQSFSDKVNTLNDREHKREDVLQVIKSVRSAGMDNINLDIICGLIGETEQSWEQTVNDLIEVSPEHVTIYFLSLRPQTKAYKRTQTDLTLPSEEKRIEMYKHAHTKLLSCGYIQTTANCFIKRPEFEHIHQSHAWNSMPLIGLGNSAYSFVNGSVMQNVRSIPKYKKLLSKGDSPIEIGRRLSAKDQMIRYVILRLKQLRIDNGDFRKRFGFEIDEIFTPQIKSLQKAGLVNIKDNSINLTFDGTIYVDDVCRMFYGNDVR